MPAPTEPNANVSSSDARPVPDTHSETVVAPNATSSGATALFGAGAPRTPDALGPYRIVKELGRGGMGAVFAALDTRLDRQLALKVMLPEFAADASAKERFLREARAAAKISHDNVVTVYEADERDGVPYIAMQFLEGLPLDAYLKKKGTPTVQQVLRIGTEAAAGLAAAHKLGLVHRDIKPANLWLEAPNGRVKVLDFGLAKPVHAETEITQSGAIVGTPAYMSPEQARGEKVDHRTDLFSLGAVLYRLCAGKVPFGGATTMAVLMALGTEEPPPVREVNPDVPEALAALIHQLLSKKADARPQSAIEVAKRLQAIAEDLAVPRALPLDQSTSLPHVVQPQVAYAVMPVSVAPRSPFADLDAPDSNVKTEAVSDAPAADPAPTRAKRGSPWPLVGGALVLAALVVVGVVFALKNKGKDTAETKPDAPDGTVGKDKDKTPPVGPGKKDPPVADPDRKAAEYALSVGGAVWVNGNPTQLPNKELTKEQFTLTGVSFYTNDRVTDSGLTVFKDCKNLTYLELWGCAQVTNTGLAHFSQCFELQKLRLNGNNGKISDGVAAFKNCKKLTHLTIEQCQTTGEGFQNFKGCAALTELHINQTPITNEILAVFSNCKELTTLNLSLTEVEDTGLATFRNCKGLTSLNVVSTKVTPKGLADFHAAVPACKIVHDGGTIEPKVVADPDRAAVEWVFSCGGYVHLTGVKGFVTEPGTQPKTPFTVMGVYLEKKTITDAGLANLANLTDLSQINVNFTAMSDAGVAHFKGLKGLRHLAAVNTTVSDAGLEHLKDLKNLDFLDLGGTKVTDAGVPILKGYTKLRWLSLHDTQITAACLPHLKELKSLKELILTNTKLTAKELEALAQALTGCKIVHDGGTIEPKK
jgi:serine/threonine protein kinase/Leucine-rich repeat (LRR) protein